MAAIHDLIAQVADERLRERLAAEWARATRERKFGLVFEDHLPELLPLPKARPRKGDLVAPRGRPLKDLWQVRGAKDGRLQCARPQAGGDAGAAAAGNQAEFDPAEVVVVREFGEPVFPALVPVDEVQNGGPEAPWHTLIEADNYHALQLLEYLYAGKVDCIYIDPPYNTGARDWKYNNDYVDGNDAWRHSKWLAFMRRRLAIARRLLDPQKGVLIVTIDEHEIHHLGVLLEQQLPEWTRQTVTVVINQKGVAQGRFSRVEEFAFFCFAPGALVLPDYDDLLSPDRAQAKRFQTPRWERLQRGGNNATPDARPGLFYPVYVDPASRRVVRVGRPLPRGDRPAAEQLGDPRIAWPIRRDGSYATWQVGPETLERICSLGYVKLGGYDAKRLTWTIMFLGAKAERQIAEGELIVTGRDDELGCVEVAYAVAEQRSLKTVWHRQLHDSGIYGSTLLKAILAGGGQFKYPKSLYSTKDALSAAVRSNPEALIVDFFAGSGTTLNAVNLLNAVDGGRRRCILVTNNEVSAAEAEALGERGLQPGDDEWEAQGICRSVTWPRSKFTIQGRRDDGTPLPGTYLTGRSVQREKARRFVQIGFVESGQIDTPAKKKQVLALIEGLPQTLMDDDNAPFIVSEDHAASVLFDPAAAEAWLEALDGQDHISSVYVVTPKKKVFDEIKAAVADLLGPLNIPEDETRPMSDGFSANLAYFKLDFLDPERVSLKRAFREVLPLLWLKAGAVGSRPALAAGEPEPVLFAPEGSNFVVLLQESRLTRLLRTVQQRGATLSHVFVVTDSDESFKRMAAEVRAAASGAGSAPLQVLQLYRDYLANFLINRQHDAGDATGGAAP
jgi:adenine-specific DNA-methyltransferase